MRYTFGGGLADFAIAAPSSNASVVKAVANLTGGTFWSAAVGGTQYTDLIATGTDPTPITSDSNGFIRAFQGPDGVQRGWIDFGAGQRRFVTSQEASSATTDASALTTGTLNAARLPDLSGTYDPVQIFDVRKYGAKGDGTTDDYAAINAAINDAVSAGGGIIAYTSKGLPNVWRISATLSVHSSVTHRGAGLALTTIKPYQSAAFSGSGTLAAPIADARWEDMTWDGQDIPTSNIVKGHFSQFLLRPVWRNVRCINFTATGFGSDYLQDYAYINCIAENNGRGQNVGDPGMSGFGIGTGKYQTEAGVIQGCVARNNKNYGIFFERQGSSATYMSRGVRVVGNHCEGNQWGIGDCGIEGIVVTGNTLVGNLADGFYSSAGTGASPLGRPGQRGVVTGNVAKNNGRDGFHLDYSVYSSNANQAYYLIADNTADGNTRNGIRIEAGKWSSDVLRGVTVRGNTVHGNGASGINVSTTTAGGDGGSAVADLCIEANKVLANGQTDTTPAVQGIRVAANTTRLTVRGNKAHDDGATKKQAYGLYTDSGYTHTDAAVIDNDLRTNLTGAVSHNGTWAGTTEVRGNLGYNPVFGFPASVDTALLRGTDAQALSANQAVFLRVRDGGTISKIALEVGASSGNISVAVYANTGSGRTAAPGVRLATSGAVACPAAGYAEVSLGSTVPVQPGDWLALSADNATATFRCLLAGSVSSQLGAGRTAMQDTTGHPLPASPAPYAVEGKSIVLIGVP